MKLDAKEAKEQEKLRQEELIKARKEEREKLEKQLQEGDGKGTETEVSSDSVEISEEGKHQAEMAGTSSSAPVDSSGEAVYDPSGETAEPEARTGENVDVSV